MNASFTEGLSFDENGSFFLHSDFKQDPFLMGSESPQITPMRRKPTNEPENIRLQSEKLKNKNNLIYSEKKSSPSLGANFRDLDMMDALKKENFGLKLRLFYMQERLSQQNRTENNEELLQENIELKASLQERAKELEERNRLLMKARNAIETLQTDLEMARAQARQIKVVESHENHKLSQTSQTYRQQVMDMETQMSSKTEQFKSLQDKVNTYQYKIDFYSEENEKLKQTVQKLQAELHSLKMLDSEAKIKRFEDVQEKLWTANQQIDAKEREILKVQQEASDKLYQLESTVSDCRAQLQEKNRFIQETMITLEAMSKNHHKLTEESNDLRHTITKLEEEKSKWNSLEAALKSDLAQRDQSVARYSEEINQKNLKIKDMMRDIAEKDLTCHKLQITLDDAKRENDMSREQLRIVESNYQEKFRRLEVQLQRSVEDQRLQTQKAKQDFEELLRQEILKREDLQRKLIEMDSLNDDNKRLKGQIEERNLLLSHTDSLLNDLLPETINTSYQDNRRHFEEFSLFQEKLIEKLQIIVKLQRQLQQEESRAVKQERDLKAKYTQASENLHKVETELQVVKGESSNSASQLFHLNQRVQVLELELEQKNIMLSGWAKDKAELEEKRLLTSHYESERLQLHNHIQKLKDDLQSAKRNVNQLEEKSKDLQKYEEDRRILQQLRLEMEVLKKVDLDKDSENQLLMDRIKYLESQIVILSKQRSEDEQELPSDISELRKVSEQNGTRLKEMQSKLDRLSENNRLLILELEEKRALTQEMNKKYQNVYKENNDLKSDLRQLRRDMAAVVQGRGNFKVNNVPELEKQILKQVEETQALMMHTQQTVEQEKKKVQENFKATQHVVNEQNEFI